MGQAKLELRPMNPADIPRLLEIEREFRARPWSAETFLAEIDNPLCRATVLKAGERLAGYILTWLVADELQIHYLAVGQADRGRGWGQHLLLDALEKAVAQGAITATLEVRESNLAARALYEKFRFQEVGRRRGYYRETGEDAILMNARLDDPTYAALLKAIRRDLG